jgi:hypothetical protein
MSESGDPAPSPGGLAYGRDWWANAKQFLSGSNTENITAVLPVQEYRFNEMYPYTVEQTVKVTHYTKPKRRDASRRWKR